MSALGYVDFGFFGASGNGVGIVQDSGALARRVSSRSTPNRYGWVFLGDILAPAINTRGEVADLGDFAGVDRFDSVNSRGAPGFIVNEVNLTLIAALTPTALATASVNFIPRTGRDFASATSSTSTSRRSSGCRRDRGGRRSSSARSTRSSASSTASARPTSASASRRR